MADKKDTKQNEDQVEVKVSKTRTMAQRSSSGQSSGKSGNTSAKSQQAGSGQTVSSRGKTVKPDNPKVTAKQNKARNAPKPTSSNPPTKAKQEGSSTPDAKLKLNREEIAALEDDMEQGSPMPGATYTPPEENNQDSKQDQNNGADNNGGTGSDNQAQPDEPQKKSGKWKLKTLLTVLGVFIIGVLGVLAYLQFIAPKLALAQYFEKTQQQETGNYDLTAAFFSASSDDEDKAADVTIKASGAFDERNPDASKLSAELEGSVSLGGSGSFSLKSDLVMEGTTLYIDLASLNLFGPPSQAEEEQWSRLDLAQAGGGQGCSQEDYQKLSAYFEEEALNTLSVSDTKRESLLPTTVDGRRAAHYSGAVDMDSVKKLLQGTSGIASEQCTGTVSEEDLQELDKYNVTYELWRGRDFDRLKLVLTKDDGSSVELTLTTDNYGDDVTIEVPEDAEPFDLLDGLLQNVQPGGSSAVPAPGGGDTSNFVAPDVELETQ